MDVKIAPDWKELLAPEFEKPYFVALTDFVRQEYATRRIYPRGSNIFRAFDKCPFDRLKVVIIGQDPYHGPGQANGLCFSVADGIPFPPSLQNIFKEVSDDTGTPVPASGNLDRWAEQGVLPAGLPRYGMTSGLEVNLRGLVGDAGTIHGLNHFGYSAPFKVLDEKFGYNGETVAAEVKKMLGR